MADLRSSADAIRHLHGEPLIATTTVRTLEWWATTFTFPGPTKLKRQDAASMRRKIK